MFILMFILIPFWIFFSWNFHLHIVLLGVISIFLTSFIIYKMFVIVSNTSSKTIKFQYIGYLLITFFEMIKADFNLAFFCLNYKNKNKDGCFVDVNSNMKKDFSNFLYANSITITPGTLSVAINDNKIQVHCVDDKYSHTLGDKNYDVFKKNLLKIENL